MANHDASSCFIYDVFLSFRGYTRYGFTDCLYRALTRNGIKTFRDNEDLRVGDEIRPTLVEAIERSRMSIVVLCQNYASSTWCLDEIVKIMECSDKGRKRPVLPIFYQVEPSDVRYQKEQFGIAMSKHESRYDRDSDRMKAWRSALYAVGDLSGQHCTKNMYEGEIIDKIIDGVFKRLPLQPLLIRHLADLDSRYDEVKSLLDIESRDILCILGIYGYGGEIDKTEFAVELYNKIRHLFEAASFLANVNEKSKENINGLEDLQQTLLSEMGEEAKIKIGSIFKGSSEIKRRLGHKRVLLVLDGVDSIQQLDSLVGGGDWFGPGSRIIITTEDEDVLDKYVVDGVAIKKYCIDEGGLEGNKGRKDLEEEVVVGLMNGFNTIISQLKEDNSNRDVVCIIGMGGLGKTTLAQKIYRSKEIKELFSCRAWVCVSKDYKSREMLLSLLHCLMTCKTRFEKLGDEELKEKVRECLRRKKYFIVLDDIWEPEVWNDIRKAFPDDNNGSRILITSRNEKVANSVSTRDPYRPCFLDGEESWKLLCEKVFLGKDCPPDLELIGRSIVKNCGGLPIAIITMAGILSKKKRIPKEWLKIKEHSNWHIANEKTNAMDVLKLSYDDLPQKLKPCFLYFGIYPEDRTIRARELIQLWIAEGLVQPQENGVLNPPEPEDVGEEYLNELVDRNLVIVSRRRSDDGVKECQIHDLIRDLCISESKTDKFFEVCTNSNFHTPSNPQRLSLLCNVQSYISSIKCDQSCTHSLFFFDEEESKGDVLRKFPAVRVLYVKELSCFRNAPSDFKSMTRLKFLKIERCSMQSTPDCLWELENLETLDIRCDCIDKIPSKVWKLKQLRHLYVQAFPKLRDHKIFGTRRRIMWNLQTLKVVLVDETLGFLLGEGIFPNLRNLGLRFDWSPSDSHPEHLRSLHCLTKLRTLSIEICYLWVFSLEAITFPSSLTKITLSKVQGLNSKDMNALGRIPNLQILKIESASQMKEDTLCCGSPGDFPELQVFHMQYVYAIKIMLEEGVMPRLQRVVIRDYLRLVEIPERFKSLLGSEYWETPFHM